MHREFRFNVMLDADGLTSDERILNEKVLVQGVVDAVFENENGELILVDYKTDKALRTALKEHSADTTCLIVAQRIGTIKHADKIIVLDKGSIVGEGTHKELMKKCAVYKEIALSQLSKEELDNA